MSTVVRHSRLLDLDRRVAEARQLDPRWHKAEGPRVYREGVVRWYSPTTRGEDAFDLYLELEQLPGGVHAAEREGCHDVMAGGEWFEGDSATEAIALAWLGTRNLTKEA